MLSSIFTESAHRLIQSESQHVHMYNVPSVYDQNQERPLVEERIAIRAPGLAMLEENCACRMHSAHIAKERTPFSARF